MSKEIEALKDEVAALREQLQALAMAMVELAAKQPVQYVPYVPYVPTPAYPAYPPTPWITYSTKIDTQCATLGAEGIAWNGASA